MSRWFRHYAGMMRDEKLVRVALQSKQPIERVLWVWGAILESASEVNDCGRFNIDPAEIAYFLRADEADILSILDGLAAAERINSDRVVNWGSRQYESDRSAPRQAALRDRRRAENAGMDNPKPSRDGGVTSLSRHGDAPETETETETEKRKHIRAVADATRPRPHDDFDEFWEAYPKRDGANPRNPARKAFLVALKSGREAKDIVAGARRYRDEMRGKGQAGTPYVAQAVTWLRQARWEDYTGADPPVRPVDIPGFYAADGSRQLEAWDAYWRATKGKNAPRDRNGGWRFETEYPPGYATEAAE